MKIVFTKIERGGILDVVMTMQGVNRSDALLVRSLERKLELQNVAILRQEELDDNSEYELSDVEVSWLLSVIERQFSLSAVNPRLAGAVLDVEEKLRKVKNEDHAG